jgi:signal peptidase I
VARKNGPTLTDDTTAGRSATGNATGDSGTPGFFSIENLRTLAILIPVIFALRWSVASPYHVPTASMEPTIKVGDRLLAWKLAYNLKIPFTDIVVSEWGTPQRGDIIVFKYPRDLDMDYVKRVVAIAGDEVQIVDDVLWINGKPQERVDWNQDRRILDDIEDNREIKQLFREKLGPSEHWVMQNIPGVRRFTRSSWPPPGDPPYKVPEGAVFCVGDNRDNSTDSRVWGHVPLEYVRGKAKFVIWSLYSPPDSAWPRLRFDRFGHALDRF